MRDVLETMVNKLIESYRIVTVCSFPYVLISKHFLDSHDFKG